MNNQRMKDLIDNPDWIKDSEVRMLIHQYKLHQEMLMLRNQQIRRMKACTTEMITRTAAYMSRPWWKKIWAWRVL